MVFNSKAMPVSLTNSDFLSYPEVTRVTKVIDELNKKEAAKFLKIRGDRIEI